MKFAFFFKFKKPNYYLMKTSATITCPKCGNPVIFNLPPQTMGGKTEFCRKCSNMVSVVFSTDRDGNINDLRLT